MQAQALTRYQRAHNGKRKIRRQRIMLETLATLLNTAKQAGHTPQCRNEWPLQRHALSGIRQQHPKYQPEGTQTMDSTSCQRWRGASAQSSSAPSSGHRLQTANDGTSWTRLAVQAEPV